MIHSVTRVIKTSQVLHIVDYRTDQAYLDHDPLAVAGVEIGGIRTLLVVPMIRDKELLGAIGIFHQEVRAAVYRQADRAADQLRRAGRRRHREHAAPQRATRIASAADSYRRCAQGHQPVYLRPAGGAQYACQFVGAVVRGRYGSNLASNRQGRPLLFRCNLRLPARVR
jgi:hypothetical protein